MRKVKYLCVHSDALICIKCGGCGMPVDSPRVYATGKENLKKLGKSAMASTEREVYIKHL